MSRKGEDYRVGGGYAIDEQGNVVDTDALMEKGDVLLFNAEVMHGVAPIDPDEELDWLSFRGRWSMIASTIKTVADTDTPTQSNWRTDRDRHIRERNDVRAVSSTGVRIRGRKRCAQSSPR